MAGPASASPPSPGHDRTTPARSRTSDCAHDTAPPGKGEADYPEFSALSSLGKGPNALGQGQTVFALLALANETKSSVKPENQKEFLLRIFGSIFGERNLVLTLRAFYLLSKWRIPLLRFSYKDSQFLFRFSSLSPQAYLRVQV